MEVRPDEVLGGEEEEEEEGEVGGRVADELDEGLPDERSQGAAGRQQVDQ